LGNTLSEIAGEKAGIIKPGIPVVVAPQQNEALTVIEKVAYNLSDPLILVGKDIRYKSISHSLDGQSFRLWKGDTDNGSGMTLTIPLLGAHQVDNAATAYATLEVFNQLGLPIVRKAITNGFSRAFWPGRFEIVQKSPPVILDCAHNRDSALKLRLTIEEYFPGKSALLIFGASEDKDIQGMFIELLPVVKELFMVKSFHPRAIEPEKLVEMAKTSGCNVHIVDYIPEAVEKVIQLAGKDEVVLVTGSIFVVAEARKYLESMMNIRRY
jgi:dihydrofolate synthase/folylpolyglutamate synthase